MKRGETQLMDIGSGKKTLWLGGHSRSRHQISFEFGVDDLRFNASYWYADVDFYALEQNYHADFMGRLYFHIAAFSANVLVSLCPDRFDPGPYERYCTSDFWTFWKAVVHGVWAQWRYEHDKPDYPGPVPAIVHNEQNSGAAVRVQTGARPILSFCGGGKDSLVSLKLLQGAGEPFDTLAYSSSIYGTASRQHGLCDTLLDAAGVPATARRRIWCYDDITDSPVLDLAPEYRAHTLTAAETPASVFMALPLVLEHGYTYLCLGHERSADTGNLVWETTGQEVNHQWGKSTEAEALLSAYIRKHFVENCHYFSILKSIYDVAIFNLLRSDLDAVLHTHSCNLRKPWCGRCPKCAYVWINYMAYLPTVVVERIFHGLGNLLNVPENQVWFRQMLGLEAHTPFECIGQVEEARLAFELCRRSGLEGAAMDVFIREVPPVNVPRLLDRYLHINEKHTLPDILHDRVLSQMRKAAENARHSILTSLADTQPVRVFVEPAP